MPYYLKSGKLYKGSYHKMKDGTIHTGKTHSKNSKRLYRRKPK